LHWLFAGLVNITANMNDSCMSLEIKCFGEVIDALHAQMHSETFMCSTTRRNISASIRNKL